MSSNIFKQSSIVVFTRIAGIVLNFIGIAIVSRSLGRDHFGMYAFLNSFAFLSSMFSLGIGSELQNRLVALQYTQKDETKAQQDLFFSAFYGIFTICLISGILISSAMLFISPNTFIKTNDTNLLIIGQTLIAVFIFAQFIAQPFTISAQAMYAYGHINLNSILQLMITLLFVFALFLATHFGAGLVALSLINAAYIVANTAIIMIVFLVVMKWRFYLIKIERIKALIGLLLKKSLLFWVLGVTAVITSQSSVFLVSIIKDVGSAGDFSFFQRIFSVMGLLQLSALMPFWPKFTKDKEAGNYIEMKKTLFKIIVISMAYFCAGIIAIFLLGDLFVKLWSGRIIKPDVVTIVAFSICALVIGWTNVFSVFLNGIGNVRIQAILAVIATVIFFPIALFFGSKYGPPGILLTTAIITIPGAIILPLEVKRFFNKSLLNKKNSPAMATSQR